MQTAEAAEDREEEQQATEEGPRKSGRRRRAPDRYEGAQPAQGEPSQLSPRDRKRIKSLAARKVPREEWMIRQEGALRKYRKPTE